MMNPIKEFFRKRKTERSFKHAGPGHKLTESSNRNVRNESREQSRGHCSHSLPVQPSEGARRAGEAALARVEQNKTSVDWSLQAIRAQAKKELELEKIQTAKPTACPKDVVVKDGCPVLTVSGVYFHCPIIGPEVLPKKEIKERIKSFLYEQLEQEEGLTACLIIHTLNENRDQVSLGIETLSRYITNILDNPLEKKYRRIRVNNKVFQDRIIGLEGADHFLLAAGFQRLSENDEEFFVFPDKDGEEMLETIEMLKEALLSAEPIRPVLDRNLRVLQPAQAAVQINLPKDFFNLSIDEIKREQEAKAEEVELMTQLRTKAMRERDQIKELQVYKYTLIRVRFPDDTILQGTFYVHEKLLSVKEFVAESLADPGNEFHLLLPGGSKLNEDSSSLLELKLVPAVMLNFLWSDRTNMSEKEYLRPDILSLLSEL